MKRVYCLYRVSTKGQVDNNDIPMQRIECRRFAEEKGWTIIREEAELGVSGYKVSSEDRDKIQLIKADAADGKFDILLVFMFDRLGRREDETPFVVEWFVQHGIEVWSTQEGEQRFDNHVDKLMNYIRFWQASGESEKTSVRIKTRLDQIRQDGHFTGGVVPYGYRLVDKGRTNKKGLPVKDLEQEPIEAAVVRELFEKTAFEGYGSHTLAQSLNARKLKTHKGAKFQSNTVRRILQNPICKGYLTANDTCSPFIEELAIVDKVLFEKVADILEQRKQKNEQKRKVAMTNKGKVLLSGNIYCAHCKTRLASIKYRDVYTKKDGSESIIEQPKYICYHRSRQLNDCDGAHTYKASIIDEIIIDVVKAMLEQVKETPKDVSIEKRLDKQIRQRKQAEKELAAQHTAKAQELEKLQAEIGKCLLGKSRFTEEILSAQIDKVHAEVATLKQEHEKITAEIESQNTVKDSLGGYYDQFVSWADEFEQASLKRKKMIVCELFDRVEVGKGYAIDITVNPNYQQFLPEEENEIKNAG